MRGIGGQLTIALNATSGNDSLWTIVPLNRFFRKAYYVVQETVKSDFQRLSSILQFRFTKTPILRTTSICTNISLRFPNTQHEISKCFECFPITFSSMSQGKIFRRLVFISLISLITYAYYQYVRKSVEDRIMELKNGGRFDMLGDEKGIEP